MIAKTKITIKDYYWHQYAPAHLATVSAATRVCYASSLKQFSTFLKREAILDDVTATKWQRYQKWLERRKLSEERHRANVTIAEKVFRHAHQNGLADFAPPSSLRVIGRPRSHVDTIQGPPPPPRDASATLDAGGLGPETLRGFITRYIQTRTDIQDTTKALLIYALNDLEAFFGAERLLTSITPGDADEFRLYLRGRLSDNTSRRICGRAKQFFRAAYRKRLITEDPFADMRGVGVRPNRTRDYFVTREMATRVLAACPTDECRLIFALARFGGLRCPSEVLSLRWNHVLWGDGKLHIPSPKTAYCGKPYRIAPLFPELRPFLEMAQTTRRNADADSFVIGRGVDPPEYQRRKPNAFTPYRSGVNLRTTMTRIIRRAGLELWPKVFQNLRSSRQTELANAFPLHVVCAWLGNTEVVAREHYLSVTEAHFQRALEQVGELQPGCSDNA